MSLIIVSALLAVLLIRARPDSIEMIPSRAASIPCAEAVVGSALFRGNGLRFAATRLKSS